MIDWSALPTVLLVVALVEVFRWAVRPKRATWSVPSSEYGTVIGSKRVVGRVHVTTAQDSTLPKRKKRK